MINWAKIFTILIVITPLVMSFDCSTASQRLCGAKGGACEYYSFSNGTCTAPTECPIAGTITVWSNASFNCVPCSGASKSICQNSCVKHKFYFDDDTSIQTCTTCQAEYGSSCSKCNSSVCTQCSNGKLANDSKSCVDATCNIAYCVTCQNSKCTACDQSHTLYNGICVCYISNCQVCGNSLCYKCQNGFNLDSSKLKCSIKCIDNCLTCTSASYCDTCFDGYYSHSD